MNEAICYLGETRDYSDQWLIRILRKRFEVDVFTPDDDISRLLNYPLVVNRLYGSAVSRYDSQRIKSILNFLSANSKKVINSNLGHVLEASRLNQYQFFSNANLSYVPTTSLADFSLTSFSKPPYVLKEASVFRNKTLTVIRSVKELMEVAVEGRVEAVLQPLINSKVCYRTEFIENSHMTFLQLVNIESDHLVFQRTEEVVSTPLKSQIINNIKNVVNSIGVQTFSIEYFLRQENHPEIVDFNINSNYPPFLIQQAGHLIQDAWIGMVAQYAVLERSNITS